MALANGSYPITITATRADGVTNTYTGNIIIGDDLFANIGHIVNTHTLHPVTTHVVGNAGHITNTQTLHSVTVAIEQSDVMANIGVITNTQMLHSFNAIIESGDVIANIGRVMNSQALHGVSIVISGNVILPYFSKSGILDITPKYGVEWI